MSEWLSKTISHAEQLDDWFSPIRSAAVQSLHDTSWPNRKTEAWKYTSLRPVERFKSVPETVAEPDVPALAKIADLDAIDVFFGHGRCAFDDKAVLPEGLSIELLANASPAAQQLALNKFSTIKPSRHFFGLVNDALADHLVYIKVDAGAHITQPIRLTSLFSEQEQMHTRVFVEIGKQAKVTILEQYQGSTASLNTGFVEYEVAEEAYLEHYRFALQTEKSVALGGTHFKLDSHAELNSTIVGFGSDLSRLDVDVIHAGERALAKINAFYLLKDTETFDLHSTIEHAVPNGTTEENVRIIAADKAKAVFNGRIHIHRDAQKTLAELNNRNLLMSRGAEINTKPELEIYADDVRCAHGATVAEIDKKAMYYLQSRGVPHNQAQVMLSFGFINELIDSMPNEALAEWLRPQVRARFTQMTLKEGA